MKKNHFYLPLLLFFALMPGMFPAWGKPVSVEQARACAARSGLLPTAPPAAAPRGARGAQRAPYEAPLRLVYTLTDTEGHSDRPLLYVFSPAEGSGFVVVAADDAAGSVMGYSPHAPFRAHNLPPQLHALLRQLGLRVTAAADNAPAEQRANAPKPAPVIGRKAIKPLLGDIRWGQDAPFNASTPLMRGAKTPTGCVATALAQVLYFHRHPRKATGTSRYSFSDMFLPGKLVDLGTKGEYQWEAMRPYYDITKPLTDNERNAIGLLLFEVGAACHMVYGTSESNSAGADALKALREHLQYPAARLVRRMHTDADAWERLIYSELAEKRPVYLDGLAAGLGHAFVCDGYDGNGFFHINWGWNGVANGYFSMSDLAPEIRGTGGRGRGSYVVELQAIVGIAPPPFQGTQANAEGLLAKAVGKNAQYSDADPRFDIIGVRLEGYETLEADFSFGIRTPDGAVLNVGQAAAWEIRKLLTYNKIEVPLRTELLPDGNHHLIPICSPRGANQWREIPVGRYANHTIRVHKQQGVFSAEVAHNPVTLEASSEKNFLLADTENEFRFRIRNNGNSAYSSYISVYFTDTPPAEASAPAKETLRTNLLPLHLEPGEVRELTVGHRPAAAANCYANLMFDPANGVSELDEIIPTRALHTFPLAVADPAHYAAPLTAAFDSAVYTLPRNASLRAAAKMHTTASGTQRGAFARLQCFICDINGGGVRIRYPEFEALLNIGDEKTVPFGGEVSLPEGEYELLLTKNTRTNNSTDYTPVAQATLRIVAPTPSTPDNPTVNSATTSATPHRIGLYPQPADTWMAVSGLAAPARVEVLAPSGAMVLHGTATPDNPIPVAHLPRGVYVVRIHTSKAVYTQRLIKQ